MILTLTESRARVDAAHQRMQTLVSTRHSPADARQAAAELSAALRDATTAAVQGLRLAQSTPPPSPGGWRRRPALHIDPTAVRGWSRELVRLSEIAGWLRRTTLDDPGVHVPATEQVATRAATGPRIAGLDFEPADPTETPEVRPRIGLDLKDIIDNVSRRPTAAGQIVTDRVDCVEDVGHAS